MLSTRAVNCVPDWFCRLCQLNLHNSKKSFADISDLIKSDPFLKLYINESFSEFMKKGGLLGMLNAIGWEGLRNRLGEAILHKHDTGSYPKKLEFDYIESVIDFEKRFEFLFTEGNSRIFLLGVFLKTAELQGTRDEDSSLVIPVELDEAISEMKSKSETPDWLLFSMLALMDVLGESIAISQLKKHQANIDIIIDSLSQEESDLFFNLLLKYGHGINEEEFFQESKVL